MIVPRVKETTFVSETVKDSGTGNRAEQVDTGHIDTGLLDKRLNPAGQLKGILIEAVDKTAVDANAGFTNILYALHLTV